LSGQSEIDNVRDATDLVRLIGEHIALRPKGREHVGLCPFHDDKNPSMAVVTHKGNAFYKCHACGAGGDAFDFVMNYHRMEFSEALRLLADRAGITLQPRARRNGSEAESGGSKRTDLKKANAFAATFFRRALVDPTAGKAARQVIGQRGISDEMVEAFMLGAAPDQWDGLVNRIRKQSLDESIFISAGLLKQRQQSSSSGSSGGSGGGNYDAFRNRLIFPICDELGNPIAFGARKINPADEPKYLNSAESALFSKSKTLYGLNLARRSIIESKQAIVTEGYTDVIACHQAGITNVVATLGTALTREHAEHLQRFCSSVVLLFDGDEAGLKAADRALHVFFSTAVDIKICVLPEALDPDELLREASGRERFAIALANAVDALDYKIARSSHRSAIGQQNLDPLLREFDELGFVNLHDTRRRTAILAIAKAFNVFAHTVEEALIRVQSQRKVARSHPEQVCHESDDTEDLARVRRMAEFELLAIAIFEPSSAVALLHKYDSAFGDLAIETPFDPKRFFHPLARAIAEVIEPRLRSGQTFTVQQIMAELNDQESRRLASQLYFDGETICAHDEKRAPIAILEALHALDVCLKRAQLERAVNGQDDSPSHPLLRTQEFIKRRRQVGTIASAIPRGVRS
jgi:DNA primase